MATSFAAREQRVNAAAIRHLANAEAIYTPEGGAQLVDPVPVIFDAEYLAVLDGEVSSAGPAATIDATWLPVPPKRGDRLTIRGIDYDAVEAQPDGTGFIVIRLRK